MCQHFVVESLFKEFHNTNFSIKSVTLFLNVENSFYKYLESKKLPETSKASVVKKKTNTFISYI